MPLSAMTGRLCAMISVIIPAYLVVVMAGPKRALEVWPAILICGVSFAATQFYVSNYIGHELTDILSSLACISAMVLVLKFWKPPTIMRLEGDKEATIAPKQHSGQGSLRRVAAVPAPRGVRADVGRGRPSRRSSTGSRNGLLPGFLPLNPNVLNGINVPGLHNMITRIPPVTPAPAPYGAVYTLNWLSASGTSCFLAGVAAAILLRVKPKQFAATYVATFKQLKMSMVTIATMLGLAYLMNYSGMTSTLGLALATTGPTFPFFSAVLGWLGVFLTGSDTSANALFGNLQVVTANTLGLNPVLTASVNSAAGVMGKMISLTSIAVAVAATGMTSADESKLFRFTIKHSILLMLVMGVISMMYAYVFPQYVPVVPPK